MKSTELRNNFLEYFKKHGHTIVPSSSLLPTDPSVLFTTAGMQQFKPYYLGEKSPYGKRVTSCQKCIRTSDIEEVGDERHLTFFEMLGSFSFGQDASDSCEAGSPVCGYWKKEAIELAHKFITEELGLEIDYVTVFKGSRDIPFDQESFDAWKKIGIKESKIKKEGADNFWGPTGEEGPCGPTTEIYVNGIEIWNIVFNEFFCDKNKKLEPLKISGIDTGMGLERLTMVAQKKENVYETDVFEPIMKILPGHLDERKKRIIADHARAGTFLISDGVVPSNKDQGYILRRLLRRMIVHMRGLDETELADPIKKVIETYRDLYDLDEIKILSVVKDEAEKFEKTLAAGLRAIKKINVINGKEAFLLYETYGFPLEVLEEMRVVENREDFFEELKKHQELSRTASAGMFKGGLADHSEETIKLHTAHHLLLAVLQELFGKQVKQKGSNVNSERLRLDFSFDRKLTDDEKQRVEDIVNKKIKEGLDVIKEEMPKEEAEKIGAEMEFGVKYGNTVSVYFVKDKKGNVFSKEFCGGPHVKNTSELGQFKIIKEEASSSGVRRIKAVLK